MEENNKEIAIKVSNVKKKYKLGQIGGGTLKADVESWWAKVRGKEDPNSIIGDDKRSNGTVFMALNGDLNLSSIANKETKKSEPNAKITPGQIREKFGLTPKEAQVFKELTETDDKQEAIALRMNMSVNTLRHHITSIYKKTGAQTRAALCKLNITDE